MSFLIIGFGLQKLWKAKIFLGTLRLGLGDRLTCECLVTLGDLGGGFQCSRLFHLELRECYCDDRILITLGDETYAWGEVICSDRNADSEVVSLVNSTHRVHVWNFYVKLGPGSKVSIPKTFLYHTYIFRGFWKEFHIRIKYNWWMTI